MKSTALVDSLEHSARVIETLVRGTSREQATWKPSPEKWSLLEVTAHLLDEERDDFRRRIDLTLHQPDADWPPIDPTGWVTQRGYALRDLEETLNAFLEERTRSLQWLRKLDDPRWDTAREHPVAGKLAAGDLLASWAAHDLQHIRQLGRLRYEYVQALARPYSVAYAG